VDQANKERDDWKGRLETIRKERDDLMEKLKNQPEKVVYKEKPAEAMSENPPMSSEGNPEEGSATPPQGDEYWAKILKQKAQLEVELDKAQGRSGQECFTGCRSKKREFWTQHAGQGPDQRLKQKLNTVSQW